MFHASWPRRVLFGFICLWTAGSLSATEPKVKIEPHPDSQGGLRLRMICGDRATDKRMELLRNYPTIEVLEAFGSEEFTDAGLAHLSALPKLRTLGLGGERLTAAGLESIRGKATLKTVTINDLPLTIALADVLASLPNLETLRLRPDAVEPGAWKVLARSPRLQELLVTNSVSSTDRAELDGLEDFTQLRKLTLYNNGFGPESISRFAGNKQLQELTLMSIPLTDEAGAAVEHFPALTTLNIHYATATPGAIKKLESLVSLRHLQVHSDELQSGDLLLFKPFRKLRTLDVHGQRITEADTHELRSALHNTVVNRYNWKHNRSDLESIAKHVDQNTAGDVVSVTMICHERATDAKVGILHQFPTIEHLWLACGDELTDYGLLELRTLKNLRELEVNSRGVTDAGLLHLKECTQLKKVHLRTKQVTPEGIAKLQTLRRDLEIMRAE